MVALAIPGVPLSLAVGESMQLRAVVVYSDGTATPPAAEVLWRSSNNAVLTLWPGGVLVAVGSGDATITASAGELTGSVAVAAARPVSDGRHVQGRVVDCVSGAGIAGLSLRFRQLPDGLRTETTTDGAGAYAIDLPAANYVVQTDERDIGVLLVRVGGPAFRGELLVNGPGCIARYGTIIDAVTFRPVAGASVTYGGVTALTGPDGWYRLDHSCAGSILGGTTGIRVTHPEYAEAFQITGRGLNSITRIDLDLRRP